MNSGKIYPGTVGLLVRVNTGLDLASSTIHDLKATKPNGVIETWTGSVNGTYIEYLTTGTDIDIEGRYKIQAYVEQGTYKGLGRTDYIRIQEVNK